MKKLSPKTISFLQAAGIVAYVLLFASTVQYFGHRYHNVEVNPFFSMALFLTAFVFSASVCISIFLGYPAYLFFGGKKKEAGRLILGSIAWLAMFLIVFLAIFLSTASPK